MAAVPLMAVRHLVSVSNERNALQQRQGEHNIGDDALITRVRPCARQSGP